MFVAGSEGSISNDIACQYGLTYIETPNFPLSHKHNEVLKLSKQWNPDGVVLIGSDDVMCDNVLMYYNNYLKNNKTEPTGFVDAHFLWSDLTGYWSGYSNHRIGETMGAGRLYPKYCLDMIDWDLWNESQNCGLDYIATQRIKNKNIKLNSLSLKDIDGFIIGIESKIGVAKKVDKSICTEIGIDYSSLNDFDENKIRNILKNE
jgi:hypothetical protein